MWGTLLLGLLDAAAESANNDAVTLQNQQTQEAMRVQSQYQLAMEQEKTRQQKEETKRAIASGVISGVFDFLTAAAAATNTDTTSNTTSPKK